MIAGPQAYICNECVQLCTKIIDEECQFEEQLPKDIDEETNKEIRKEQKEFLDTFMNAIEEKNTAFKVRLNGRALCTVGMKSDGFTMIELRNSSGPYGLQSTKIDITGIPSDYRTQAFWNEERLEIGDKVEIEVVKTEKIDQPKLERDSYAREKKKKEKKT